MQKPLIRSFLVLTALPFVACSGDDTGSSCDPLRDVRCTSNNNSDSSVNTRRDASITTNPDATVNNRPDATVNNRPDATVNNRPDATLNPDSSIPNPDGSVTSPDGSVGPDGGSCGDIPPPPSGPPPCTQATVACIDACDTDNCVFSCLQATAGCAECVQTADAFCPARNGCSSQTSDLLCCLDQDCANAQDVAACVQSNCPAIGNAYSACLQTDPVINACLDLFGPEYATCFPSVADAGMPDGAVDGGVRACERPIDPIPDNVHTFCEPTTRTCIAGATTQGQYDACIAADTAAEYDPDPNDPNNALLDCGWCIGYTQNSCASNNGCGNQLADLFCCVDDNSCADSACINNSCGTEVNTVNTCYSGIAATCGNFAGALFDPCF